MTKYVLLTVLWLAVAWAAVLPSAGAPAKIESVSIGISAWSPFFYVPMVGVEKGSFEKHGIKLRVVLTESAGPAIQAVLGGSVNMAATTSGFAFLAQMQAPELKQIIGVVERSPYTLLVRPGIRSVADLKGKAVGGTGVRSGEDTETMRLMLREAGLSESDYTIVAVGGSTARREALIGGRIAGVIELEPHVTMLREAGMVPLARASDYRATRDLNLVVLVALRPWYTSHQTRMTNFVRAWAEATDWLYDPRNKAEAIRIYAREMKLSGHHAAATYRVMVEEIKVYSPRGRLSRDGLRSSAEAMRFLGHTVPGDVDAYADRTPWERAVAR